MTAAPRSGRFCAEYHACSSFSNDDLAYICARLPQQVLDIVIQAHAQHPTGSLGDPFYWALLASRLDAARGSAIRSVMDNFDWRIGRAMHHHRWHEWHEWHWHRADPLRELDAICRAVAANLHAIDRERMLGAWSYLRQGLAPSSCGMLSAVKGYQSSVLKNPTDGAFIRTLLDFETTLRAIQPHYKAMFVRRLSQDEIRRSHWGFRHLAQQRDASVSPDGSFDPKEVVTLLIAEECASLGAVAVELHSVRHELSAAYNRRVSRAMTHAAALPADAADAAVARLADVYSFEDLEYWCETSDRAEPAGTPGWKPACTIERRSRLRQLCDLAILRQREDVLRDVVKATSYSDVMSACGGDEQLAMAFWTLLVDEPPRH